MSIQSEINQTISLAGYLTSFNPALKAGVERRKRLQDLESQRYETSSAAHQAQKKRRELEQQLSTETEAAAVSGGNNRVRQVEERLEALDRTEAGIAERSARIAAETFELNPRSDTLNEHLRKQSALQRQERQTAARREAAERASQQAAVARDAEVARSRRIESIIESFDDMLH